MNWQRAADEEEEKEKIILATVKGDIHDIGKNIVKVLLENYSFDVLDLGKDVPPEIDCRDCSKRRYQAGWIKCADDDNCSQHGRDDQTAQQRKDRDCKVMVGGAVLNQDYADHDRCRFLWKRCNAIRILCTESIRTGIDR